MFRVTFSLYMLRLYSSVLSVTWLIHAGKDWLRKILSLVPTLGRLNKYEPHNDGKTTQFQSLDFVVLSLTVESIFKRVKWVNFIFRALCCWCGRSDYASVLPFRRHRQHCLSYGIHWAA